MFLWISLVQLVWLYIMYTVIYFWYLIKSNWNQNVFTILRFMWNQTDVRLVPDQSESPKYNLISVWFNNISKRYLCVQLQWVFKEYSSYLQTLRGVFLRSLSNRIKNSICNHWFKLSKSINGFLVSALTFFTDNFRRPHPPMRLHARPRKQSVSFIHWLKVSIIF